MLTERITSMPASVKVDAKNRIIYTAFEGKLNDGDFLAYRQVLKDHPDFHPEFSEVLDFSNVTELRVTVAFINSLAKSNSLYSPESKHAVVAPHDISFGVARLYQMLAQDTRPNLAVVRSMAEARMFVGIEPQDF